MSEDKDDWFSWASGVVAEAKEKRVVFEKLFSAEARRAVRKAIEHAEASGSEVIGADHLFISLVSALDATRVPSDLRAAADELTQQISAKRRARSTTRKAGFSARVSEIIRNAPKEAASLGRTTVEPEHFFLALLGEPEGTVARALADRGIDREALRTRLIAEFSATKDGEDFIPKA